MAGAMQIDPGAWKDLELVESAEKSNAKCTFYDAINHTQTKMGGRLLRSSILQPSADLSTIFARQSAVTQLLDSEELFFFLSSNLSTFPDIDSVITSLIRLSSATTVKQASHIINNVLSVKHILQASKSVASGIGGNSDSDLLVEIAEVLSDCRIDQLLDHIHSVIRPDISTGYSAQAMRSQRCHAVKVNVQIHSRDYAVYETRSIFDKVSQEVVDLVEQYSSELAIDELQLPIRALYKPATGYIMAAKLDALEDGIPEEFVNVVAKKSMHTFTTLDMIKLNNRLSSVVTEISLLTDRAINSVVDVIRENIVILYGISEAVALLDMITSFAHLCTVNSYTLPIFSDALNVMDSRHPILEEMGCEVTPNNIDSTGATFTIISGPNMGGKSTYLRQTAYMVILAQIGSYVPASSASFKVFDKLLVRMNGNDDLSESEATFMREMRDMAYVLSSYDRNSLVLVDELGRSTSAREGKAICRAICEEFCESEATVFVTTHFLDLPHILATHRNCTGLVLSAQNEEGEVVQRYKAALGSQTESFYGIRLAQSMGLPDDVIDTAKQVADEA
ncbi:MutS protein msh4, partial [Dipsacomyces acuminosporus]